MLKHEDWPGLAKLSTIRAAGDEGKVRRVSILTGNGGGLFLPEELSRGADGAMTGFAWPEMMVDVVAAHARGDIERAHDLFDAYLPLARYEQQAGVGLAVRKHLLHRARRDRLAPSSASRGRSFPPRTWPTSTASFAVRTNACASSDRRARQEAVGAALAGSRARARLVPVHTGISSRIQSSADP